MPEVGTDDRVVALVREVLESIGEDATVELGRDSFLPDFLDSVGLTALVAAVEDEWTITIEDDELEPALFESPSSLAEVVERKTKP